MLLCIYVLEMDVYMHVCVCTCVFVCLCACGKQRLMLGGLPQSSSTVVLLFLFVLFVGWFGLFIYFELGSLNEPGALVWFVYLFIYLLIYFELGSLSEPGAYGFS